MRKYRKFNEGGSSDLEDFEDKAMPKRYSALEELASGREKGSFDEDVYARAKRFVDRGGDEAPKVAAKPAARRAVAPAGTPGGAYRGQRSDMVSAPAAEIPKASAVSAPASTGEDTSGPSNLDRILMGTGAGAGIAGIAGAAKLAQMRRAKQAAEMSKAAAAKFSQPQARQIATQTGAKKQPAEQVKKESPSPAKDSSETASPRKSRNIFERPPKKSDTETARTGSTGAPRSRNTVGRDEEMTRRNFSSGGKVRGGGCEMRGKTRGVMR